MYIAFIHIVSPQFIQVGEVESSLLFLCYPELSRVERYIYGISFTYTTINMFQSSLPQSSLPRMWPTKLGLYQFRTCTGEMTVPHVERDLLNLLGHLRSLPVLCWVRVAQSFVGYDVFCLILFDILSLFCFVLCTGCVFSIILNSQECRLQLFFLI